MSRDSQGLPPQITDDQTLDQAAALLADLVGEVLRDQGRDDRVQDGAA
jgi:hypothetical protein